MKTSDFFDSNVTTQIDESETRGVGACALCDPEFDVDTTQINHASGVQHTHVSDVYYASRPVRC